MADLGPSQRDAPTPKGETGQNTEPNTGPNTGSTTGPKTGPEVQTETGPDTRSDHPAESAEPDADTDTDAHTDPRDPEVVAETITAPTTKDELRRARTKARRQAQREALAAGQTEAEAEAAAEAAAAAIVLPQAKGPQPDPDADPDADTNGDDLPHRGRTRQRDPDADTDDGGDDWDDDDLRDRPGKQKRRKKKRGRKEPAPIVIRDVARPARMRSRHWGTILAFLFFAVAPIGGVYYYLWTYAVDQYGSTLGFSVRTEEVESSLDVLGALTGGSNNSSKDTDILYEFVQSQTLVRILDSKLDLRAKWSIPENDPVFAFDPKGTIEDLEFYWSRMVRINYEASTGLMEITVTAFRPEDARDIAQGILDESSKMINDLSAIAREDSTTYARDELDLAEERLRSARLAVTEFRERTQVVDPNAVIQGQNGLLNNLQAQLAETLIEIDLLRETSRESDPRITQAQRKIEVIQARIEEERQKFSGGAGQRVGQGDKSFSEIVSEYENLTVEREFAQQAYVSALSAYNSTLAEARRQSRYLAPHALPSLAERAEYPQRITILGLFTFFNLLLFTIGSLVYYTIRDRR